MPSRLPESPAAPELAEVAAETGLRVGGVLRRTEKTLLADGVLAGLPVVVKVALDPDPFWMTKWRHEIEVYQAFAAEPPPVRIPRLVFTDNSRVLIVEKLDGHVLDLQRYPQHPVEDGELESALTAVRALNGWSQGRELFEPVFDYPDRVGRYHAAGFLTDADRDALTALLAGEYPWQVNHGDPLPSNLLITADGCVPLDWEFTGLFLPGFDLAMLHTLLLHTPNARAAIDQIVADDGITEPFLINLAMVLTRELRIHRELPPGELRDTRLPPIEATWAQTRQRLHALATRSR